METESPDLFREVRRSVLHATLLPVFVPLVALIIGRLPCLHLWPAPPIEIVLSIVKISSILGLAGHATMVKKPEVPPRTEKLYALTPPMMVIISLVLVFQNLPFCSWGVHWSTTCYLLQSNDAFFLVLAIFSFSYMAIFTWANLVAMSPPANWKVSEETRKDAKIFAEFFIYTVNFPTLTAFASILVIGLLCQLLAPDGKTVRVALEAAIALITFAATNAAICVDVYARYRLKHHLNDHEARWTSWLDSEAEPTARRKLIKSAGAYIMFVFAALASGMLLTALRDLGSRKKPG